MYRHFFSATQCSAVFSLLNVAQLPCTDELPKFSSEKSQFTPCIAVFFRAENINFLLGGFLKDCFDI
jgi:hypothetical protein